MYLRLKMYTCIKKASLRGFFPLCYLYILQKYHNDDDGSLSIFVHSESEIVGRQQSCFLFRILID